MRNLSYAFSATPCMIFYRISLCLLHEEMDEGSENSLSHDPHHRPFAVNPSTCPERDGNQVKMDLTPF